ncbi:MAG: hypothetical protein ACREDK_01295 [Thermoplasmata archaeon]
MIRALLHARRDILLLGVVRGLPDEVAPAIAEVERFRPDTIGLGIAASELRGLEEYFVDTATEPIVPLASTEAAEVRGLVRFGDVHLPNPAFVEAVAWGRAHRVAVAALDQDDEEFVDTFTDHIGYFELVRRTLRERRLAKRPPTAETADEFVLAWDRTRSPGSGSARFSAAREAALANGLGKIAPPMSRIAALVDRERFEGVLARLAGPDPARTTRTSG